MTTGMTRAAQAAQFEAVGVQGAALELLLKATAPARHLGRVEATLAAATAGVNLGPGGWAEETLPSVQAARILADIIGIGGPKVEALGLATVRLPAFQRLGKGRRQASDGGAWMAAAQGALARLCPQGLRMFVEAVLEGEHTPEGPTPGGAPCLQVYFAEGVAGDRTSCATLGVLCSDGVIPPLFYRAVALHGLRQVTGLPVREDVLGCWTGSVAAWSAVYNDACKRLVLRAGSPP
jgi:hypothetical protein